MTRATVKETGEEGPTAALVTYPMDALCSFHYFRSDTAMENVVGTKRLCLIGDSGAFSALTQGKPVGFGEYVEWAKRWDPYLAWTASLDVIGDPAATLRNWRDTRDVHGLATVPTLHVGTDPAWIGNYAREGCDFIALGGMVGRALAALPWTVSVFRYAAQHHPEVRFHIWGVTNRRVLDNLPAYSADSSGILGQAYRFANLRLFDPRTARHVNVALKRADVFAHGELLRREYRVDPEAVMRSTPANRHILIQIAARGTQLYAGWLQGRHQVSPPGWAVKTPPHLDPQPGPPPHGSRVHAVGELNATDRMDLRQAVAGDGPRVHVSMADRAGERDGLTQPDGPRLHVVDTHDSGLISVATGKAPHGWAPDGVRVHLVDANHENLASATEGGDG